MVTSGEGATEAWTAKEVVTEAPSVDGATEAEVTKEGGTEAGATEGDITEPAASREGVTEEGATEGGVKDCFIELLLDFNPSFFVGRMVPLFTDLFSYKVSSTHSDNLFLVGSSTIIYVMVISSVVTND